jgi:lysozyme family protein
VDYCVFDAAINSGPSRAAKWLQSTVGVDPDGGIGPKTLQAVVAMNPTELVNAYNDRRLDFLQDLPTWGTFGKGWGRRVAEVKAAGLDMA